MRSIVYYKQNNSVETDIKIEDFDRVKADENSLLWVDLVGDTSETCQHILRDVFGFHPLAIINALEKTHIPKIDDWGDYVYLVFHIVVPEEVIDGGLHTLELDCFLGPNYLVTYQNEAIEDFSYVWATVQSDTRFFKHGVAHLLYMLMDVFTNDYMRVVDVIEAHIDDIEDQVFDNPTDTLLSLIFTLKRTLLRLRRILAPQRDVLNKLARGDYAVIPETESIYFRDIYDSLIRLYDIVDSMRDLVSGILDTYLSVVNNKMSNVVKTLTIITTFFMPMSFLASFFGMNFFHPVVDLPFWTSKVVFVVILAIMFIVPIGMYWWLYERSWL